MVDLIDLGGEMKKKVIDDECVFQAGDILGYIEN